MSDEILKSGEVDKGPFGGERLRVARRANDISVRDVAKELHLDEAKVRALEKNDFAVLGAPVFAKGHLRKYAELVGVSVDDVMADYYEMNRTAAIPPVIGPRKKRPRDINAGPWLGAAVIILLIAAAAYWWFNLRPTEASSSILPATPAPFVSTTRDQSTTRLPATQAVEESVPVNLPATPQPSAATPPPSVATSQPSAAQAAPATTAPVRSETPGETSPVAPQLVVELTYSGECWTEASDASGRRLFYDLGVAGRTVRLSGVAPVRLILGDSGNVSITVDGRPYNIPASARSGRLARLTISAR